MVYKVMRIKARGNRFTEISFKKKLPAQRYFHKTVKMGYKYVDLEKKSSGTYYVASKTPLKGLRLISKTRLLTYKKC